MLINFARKISWSTFSGCFSCTLTSTGKYYVHLYEDSFRANTSSTD